MKNRNNASTKFIFSDIAKGNSYKPVLNSRFNDSGWNSIKVRGIWIISSLVNTWFSVAFVKIIQYFTNSEIYFCPFKQVIMEVRCD